MYRTVNVIGFTQGEYVRLCYAMTKTEMAQERKKMKRNGLSVFGWYAQTKRGLMMLKTSSFDEVLLDTEVKHVPLIQCPVCEGIGYREIEFLKNQEIKFTRNCVMCNSSGYCTENHYNGWKLYAIQEMKEPFYQ